MATTHGTLVSLGRERRRAFGADLLVHRFRSMVDGRSVHVLTLGDVRGSAPLLARVHSSCVTSEFLGGVDCDCAEQLSSAIATVRRERRGVVFYLDQEGRGAGLVAKARDRMLVQASRHRLSTFEAYERMGLARDLRRYDEVAFASRLLGLRAPLRLLSNNPEKAEALARLGFDVASIEPVSGPASPFNAHYLAAKSRAGHAFAAPDGARLATLPERVVAFEPRALGGVPHLLRAASYLLPIRASEAQGWLRLHVHFDTRAKRERVGITTLGRLPRRGRVLLRLQTERTLDRFPGPAVERRRWQRAAARLLREGRGVALLRSEETAGSPLTESEIEVLASLVPSRAVIPLVDRATPAERERLEPLVAAGFDVGPALALGTGRGAPGDCA